MNVDEIYKNKEFFIVLLVIAILLILAISFYNLNRNYKAKKIKESRKKTD